MRFSIIIPTYNRADVLNAALCSALAQDYPADSFEIVVVDNNSTDRTRTTVEEASKEARVSIRYVFETRRGLHWARHAGVAAARGDVVAFTDDDALLSPQWLSALAPAYDMPDVAAAGGKVFVKWDGEPPVWARRHFQGLLGALDYGDEMRILSPGQCIHGANFSIRQSTVVKLGGFNPDNAPADPLVGDGEYGLCQKVQEAGGKIAYMPRAVVWHVVKASEAAPARIRRRGRRNGMSAIYALVQKHPALGARFVMPRLAKRLFTAGWHEIRALRKRIAKDDSQREAEYLAQVQLGMALYLTRMWLDRGLRARALQRDWFNPYFGKEGA